MPTSQPEALRNVGVYLTEEQHRRLDALAAKADRPRSWIVRTLIDTEYEAQGKPSLTPGQKSEKPPCRHQWTTGSSGLRVCGTCGEVNK